MAGSAKRDGNAPRAGGNGSTSSQPSPDSPGLDRVIQAQIGDKLRAMYGELIEQPVPDRLTAILARIGAPGRESGS
jgi:hypothetical protein